MIRNAALATFVIGCATTAATGSVTVIGGGFAQSCFLAAEAHDTSFDAMNDCDRALSEELLEPGDRVATHVNRGILFFVKADAASANADFDRALQLDPNEPDAWLNKAIVTVQYGDGVDPLPMIRKALELKTRRPAVAYYVRGIVEERRGNIRAAYDDFRRAQSLEPRWDKPGIELSRYTVRKP